MERIQTQPQPEQTLITDGCDGAPRLLEVPTKPVIARPSENRETTEGHYANTADTVDKLPVDIE
jgi:hypothetical protein